MLAATLDDVGATDVAEAIDTDVAVLEAGIADPTSDGAVDPTCPSVFSTTTVEVLLGGWNVTAVTLLNPSPTLLPAAAIETEDCGTTGARDWIGA